MPWWWASLLTTSTTRRSTRPSGDACSACSSPSPAAGPRCSCCGGGPRLTPGPASLCLRLILDGAPLIAVHKARYYRRRDALALGPGPFVTALEYAADCTASVVGKPEATFFAQALSDLGCSPSEAVMIGDVSTRPLPRPPLQPPPPLSPTTLPQPSPSPPPHGLTLAAVLLQDVRDDVAGAQDAGMLGILVRTGENGALVPVPRQPPDAASVVGLTPQGNTGKETRPRWSPLPT